MYAGWCVSVERCNNRQLFVEFADASDVRRTVQEGGPVATGLLDELQRHRKVRRIS